MTDDNIDIYNRYLRVFEDKFGVVDLGQPVRNEGYLVKKLTFDDFNLFVCKE